MPSQLLGPRAGEGSVGLDPGLVEQMLSRDADATDDREIVGFVLSGRFLGWLGVFVSRLSLVHDRRAQLGEVEQVKGPLAVEI